MSPTATVGDTAQDLTVDDPVGGVAGEALAIESAGAGGGMGVELEFDHTGQRQRRGDPGLDAGLQLEPPPRHQHRDLPRLVSINYLLFGLRSSL